jgi:hypothetical protein
LILLELAIIISWDLLSSARFGICCGSDRRHRRL